MTNIQNNVVFDFVATIRPHAFAHLYDFHAIAEMKPILMGNSLVRGLRSESFSEVICLPGAPLDDMLKHVRERRPDIRNCQLYIVEGAIRFTRKVSTENRHEVVLREDRLALAPLEWLLPAARQELKWTRRVEVVYCQMPAMSIRLVNDSLQTRHGGRRLMRAFEADWQRKLQCRIREANRSIVADNDAAGVCTPWLTKGSITSNRVFRFRRLVDGLHPDRSLVAIWKRELERVVRLNRYPFRD